MPNIPIFLSSDNNYAPFVATTIASICDNTKLFCEFYILDGGISTENQAKIYELKKQFNNFEIEFIDIDLDKEFAGIVYKNAEKRITLSTYNRFLIPKLKPYLNKVIYLDVDIIVIGDIAELYKEYLGNYAIGAVWEIYGENNFNIDRKQNLGLSESHKYFNAGVLLINSKKWRENDLLNFVLKTTIENKDKIQLADQDVLNIVFDNQYRKLPIKYNFLNKYFMEIKMNSKPVICHFVGSYKPWHIAPNYEIEQLMPNHKIFWHYAKKTHFYENLIGNTLDENESRKMLRHIQLFKIKRISKCLSLGQ